MEIFTFAPEQTVVADTLVLKIVEHDIDLLRPDTMLFVLYDTATDRYVIRGKRTETHKINSCVYSFECLSADSLADFVEFVIDSTNEVSFVLYNYTNLPATSNEITFDFLNSHLNHNRVNEIAGYDHQFLSRKKLLKDLKMLRNVFNYYC